MMKRDSNEIKPDVELLRIVEGIEAAFEGMTFSESGRTATM